MLLPELLMPKFVVPAARSPNVERSSVNARHWTEIAHPIVRVAMFVRVEVSVDENE